MAVFSEIVKANFSKLIDKYNLIVENYEGELYCCLYNQHVSIIINTEMYNRDNYIITLKIVQGEKMLFLSLFILYSYIGLSTPHNYYHKDNLKFNIQFLDNYYSWILSGNFLEFDKLVNYSIKYSLLFREQNDYNFYNEKDIPDRHKISWVSEMEHWVRHKYNLMLDMYHQEANNGKVPIYFPLNDFDKIKPLLIEQLFTNKWDNPTWDVYWGSTDYSWVKRLAEKAGF